MSDFFFRKYIRHTLKEYYNNSGIYAYGMNKFPYFKEDDDITPAELAAQFDAEFSENDIEESEENDVTELEKKVSDIE